MKPRLKKMWELAIIEAKNLKKMVTKEEINNLDFNRLDPRSPDNCIYGQMTGYCYSERAGELIKKCCIKVYSVNKGVYMENAKLNGAPYEPNSGRDNEYHSPIETLILGSNGGEIAQKKIIAFLKGETKTITIPNQ